MFPFTDSTGRVIPGQRSPEVSMGVGFYQEHLVPGSGHFGLGTCIDNEDHVLVSQRTNELNPLFNTQEAIQLKRFIRIWMHFCLGKKIETLSILDNMDKSRFIFPREKGAKDE